MRYKTGCTPYRGSVNMKDMSPDPYDMKTKKMPVSKESQATAEYAWQEKSLLLCHTEHPWYPGLSDKAALPCDVPANLKNILYLKFHFVSPADMLRNLKISTDLQDCHSELIVSKSHSLCCTSYPLHTANPLRASLQFHIKVSLIDFVSRKKSLL